MRGNNANTVALKRATEPIAKHYGWRCARCRRHIATILESNCRRCRESSALATWGRL